MKLSILLAFLLLATNANSAENLSKRLTSEGFKFMSDSEYKKAKKDAYTYYKNRKVAEVDRIDENTALSDDLKNLRNELIGGPVFKDGQKTKENFEEINSAERLATFLEVTDKKFSSLDQDAKLIAAQLSLLMPFRGFLYRARPLVEDHKLAHSFVLTLIRNMSVGINVFLPTEQWKAGIKYVADPYKGIKQDIKNDQDFYNFLINEVRPSVVTFMKRVRDDMNFEGSVYFDNNILYKTADFGVDNDRYIRLREPDRIALLGSSYFALAGLNMSAAYHWDGFFKTIHNVSKVYGFDSFTLKHPMKKATAKKRTETIKKSKDLFTIRTTANDTWMNDAYYIMKEGVRTWRLAWTMLKDDSSFPRNPQEISILLDPRFIQPFNRITGNSYDNIERILEEDGVGSAIIAGETVKVNLKKFFTENPPKDLKAFLPIKFDESDYETKKDGFEFRNYHAGAPAGWNLEVYQEYFPSVKTNEDVKKAARVLMQTWGGAVAGMPMFSVLF